MAELHLDVISTSSSKGLTDAQRDLKETRTEAGRLGKSFDELGDDAFDLEHAIAQSRAEVRRLSDEFKRTGDRTLTFDIRREKSWLHDLTTVASDGAEAGAVAGRAFSSSFGRMTLLNPYVIAGIGTAVALAGPALGAVVAGLVSGAIGTGGVAGGLLMASKSPEVRARASALGDAISAEFFKGGDVFVGPAIESMNILEAAVRDMKLDEAFAKAAPSVTTIAGGLGDLGRNIMPGVNAAFGRMGPFADAAADGMSDLGDALSIALDDITASPGAVLGLRFAFDLLSGTIIGTGKVIKFLSDAFAGLLKLGAHLGDNPIIEFLSFGTSDDWARRWQNWIKDLDKAPKGVATLSDAIATNTDAFRDNSQALIDHVEGLKAFNDVISESINVQLRQDRANLEVEDGWIDLTEALNKNGAALRDGTQAARDNERALLDQINKLAQQREANLRAGMAASDANTMFNAEVDTLIDIATNAGISKEMLDRLVGNYFVNVRFQSNFQNWMNEFGYLLPGFGGGPWGAVTSFGIGGTTPAFEPFKVHKDEMLFSDQPHYVATKAQVNEMYSASRGWDGASAGGSSTTEMRFSGDVDSAFATAFMKLVRGGKITITSKAVVA